MKSHFLSNGIAVKTVGQRIKVKQLILFEFKDGILTITYLSQHWNNNGSCYCYPLFNSFDNYTIGLNGIPKITIFKLL